MRFHLFGPPPIQPHADLVAQIAQVTAFRDGADPKTEAYERLVDMEKSLRVQLAQTPEHRAAQSGWRVRVEANARRKRMAGQRIESGDATA